MCSVCELISCFFSQFLNLLGDSGGLTCLLSGDNYEKGTEVLNYRSLKTRLFYHVFLNLVCKLQNSMVLYQIVGKATTNTQWFLFPLPL